MIGVGLHPAGEPGARVEFTEAWCEDRAESLFIIALHRCINGRKEEQTRLQNSMTSLVHTH